MGLWRFLYIGNFYYFLEGMLEVWHYFRVSKAKREPKYTHFDFVEAAKAVDNWVGIEPCSQQLR